MIFLYIFCALSGVFSAQDYCDANPEQEWWCAQAKTVLGQLSADWRSVVRDSFGKTLAEVSQDLLLEDRYKATFYHTLFGGAYIRALGLSETFMDSILRDASVLEFMRRARDFGGDASALDVDKMQARVSSCDAAYDEIQSLNNWITQRRAAVQDLQRAAIASVEGRFEEDAADIRCVREVMDLIAQNYGSDPEACQSAKSRQCAVLVLLSHGLRDFSGRTKDWQEKAYTIGENAFFGWWSKVSTYINGHFQIAAQDFQIRCEREDLRKRGFILMPQALTAPHEPSVVPFASKITLGPEESAFLSDRETLGLLGNAVGQERMKALSEIEQDLKTPRGFIKTMEFLVESRRAENKAVALLIECVRCAFAANIDVIRGSAHTVARNLYQLGMQGALV